ncbi:hypothetical protein SYNPS1DRAFT_20885 [Syncephalis pseudoplumigaleata]|uniref:GINS subunit domain-containing protein n=1 Tax=Syncephalis pseudoplumigaleata TaxID=1712513 RepID=A0A4P9Z564_9FUNG|nr:hypothetical protein SYNPS1DRAFT_20885 [Syncephalis pseudoplumigaleata]|eukprot:RKP27635.1 hypothetical protein SYNPS1DRAFT_20885 [Syncephalis pseudoplumigaleata]
MAENDHTESGGQRGATSGGDAVIDSIIEHFGVEAGIGAESARDAAHTTPSPLAQLTQAWINERATPELLPYERQLMATLEEQLVAQVNKVDRWRDQAMEQHALEMTLYQTEVERVRFVLRSYLRTRLHKVGSIYGSILACSDMEGMRAGGRLAYCGARAL